ncbi:MAG: aspartate carbamoyltransferase catalytic subunit [Pseudomonadota bacterium]
MTSASDAWQGILAPGEKILWQGRPEPGFAFVYRSAFEVIFALAFTGFSVFWMLMASLAGGFFWMFGLIFFAVGMYMLVGQHFWRRYVRERTYYTATTHAAYIATDLPLRGRTLKRYAVENMAELELRPGNPGDVIFFKDVNFGNRGSRYITDVGFERIADPASAYAILRDAKTMHRAGGDL